ncbi:MAG: amidase [Dehalococcoidia bacterium]|nr:amidase [Dehalococcoidia bacterium]
MPDNDLVYASIDELAPRIRSGALSPVELTQASLDRIGRLEPQLNAFLEVFSESALAQAREAEVDIAGGNYRGPLHGITIALKDLIDVEGTITTGGSTVLNDNMATSDATVTRLLKEAGAIIIGKAALVEFAMGATGVNPHYGPSHNPWNLERICCGSSMGSAAAVAAGLSVGALGSDTGGSIRMPAAVTGIAGLKPTYGRISRAGVLDLSWSCDHVGPMTRTVADCAHMMNVLAGHDPADPASSRQPVPDFTSELDRGFEGLRVGVPKEFFFDNVDPEVEAAVRAGIALMEREGASVREVSMPWAALGRTINIGLLGSEAAAVHREVVQTRGDELSPAVRARLESAIITPAVDYIDAQRARRVFIEQMDAVMGGLDVLVTPSVPIQTPTIAECTPPPGSPDAPGGANLTEFTGVFDTTGQPSLSMNCGFTKDGMPIGMMINGRAFDEVSVLRAGAAFEQAAGLVDRRPPLD